MQKFTVDANIGLRILVGDQDIAAAVSDAQREKITSMVSYTRQLVQLVNEGKLILVFSDAVVEEMVFVMEKVYKVPRERIAMMISVLIEADGVEASTTIRETLKLYSALKLDLIDIKLSVLSKEQGIPVLTWDQGFKVITDCDYYTPKEVIINLSQN